ncbi:dihydrolipoyl dehydrogenase family protein [Paenalkalicoccus suaedae]|uniref:dihydrolipoyl dehydrogenase family protein n=1 Tax=Paenalkalicoccus suaedae TaxID=2592382 RepID=UPI001C3763CA|nr:NAD(P)/FAD-dependent oxidoreductase [Paenalkalicoccus suaedae]
MTKKYDVAVIGAGAGGLTAAYTANGFGKKVVLIDKSKPGGECTWSGCIPSKGMINQAKEAHHARRFIQELSIDTASVMEEIRDVMETVYEGETPEVLEDAGIDYLQGHAIVKGSGRLEVDGEPIEAKFIFLATGSKPLVPPIDGLDNVPYLTNETLFQEEDLPKSMLILGGGNIGVEMAQALNRLGVKVTLVEMGPRILGRDEEELTAKLCDHLHSEGIRILVGTKAVKADYADGQVHLTCEEDNESFVLKGDKLLLALGRKPTVSGLGLAESGVEVNKKGIVVNDYLETTLKNVYAIGDVVGPYQLSHMANAQGIRAVQNALLPFKRKMSYKHVTWATYTDPEIARSGMSEEEAREKHGDSIRVYRHDYDHLDRALTKKGSFGRVKIILDKKGYILGASVLGDRAGEIIAQIQTAKTLKIKFGALSKVIHPYPTYSEILVKMAKKAYVDGIFANPIVKFALSFRKKGE